VHSARITAQRRMLDRFGITFSVESRLLEIIIERFADS